jgi:hypothetical protein
MESIYKKATKQTPKFHFNCNGQLIMEGRSFPEDVNSVYNPLIEWVKNMDAEMVTCNIDLEYINSASSKKIIELLKIIDKNDHVKNFIINWHYEEGDDDCHETGQIYEDILSKARFTFIEYAEIEA